MMTAKRGACHFPLDAPKMFSLTTTPRHTALHVLPRYFHRLAAMCLHQLEQCFCRMLRQGLQSDMLIEKGAKHVIEECFGAYW